MSLHHELQPCDAMIMAMSGELKSELTSNDTLALSPELLKIRRILRHLENVRK
jgi:hypothetical protein